MATPVKTQPPTLKSISLAVQNIYTALKHISPFINSKIGQAEPSASEKVKPAMAYADGTNWNPGSGAGWYYWNGSSWVSMGSSGAGDMKSDSTVYFTDGIPVKASDGTLMKIRLVYEDGDYILRPTR